MKGIAQYDRTNNPQKRRIMYYRLRLVSAYLSGPYLECGQLGLDSFILDWYDADSNVSIDAWEFELYPFGAEEQKTVKKHELTFYFLHILLDAKGLCLHAH